MKITFTDKTSIDNRPDLSDVEKITGGNINEIKNVVNANADELDATKIKTENLSTEVEALKQKDTAQDTNIQSNTSKIEAINKNIEAINKKNTEQDTNLQKNAKDIEANQNNIKALQVENAEVKAENERLRSDIESISLVGEAEGESIDLDDSSGARFKKFGMNGNHSQETREGYNLIGLEQNVQYKVDLKANDYIVVTNQTSNELRLELYTNYGDGEYNDFWNILSNASRKIQVAKDTKALKWTTTVDGIAWINKGETQKPYEQYGATPSLEFPSEIKTVKDNVNVVVCNENLLEINKSIREITRGGVTIELLENGNIRLNGTSTSILWVSLLEINNYSTSSWKKRFFTKGKIYGYYNYVAGSVSAGNVSFNIRETTTSSAVIGLNITADNFKANRVVQGTVKNSLNLEYLWINTGTTFNNLEFNLQLKKENNSANFVEHQEQVIIMPVQQEMLQGDYFDWKKEKEVHNWNKKIFDGTENINISKRGNSFLCGLTDILRNTKENQIPPIICNMYKTVSWENRDVNNIEESISQYGLNVGFDKGDLTTVEEFKALLKSKYDAGTPVEVYYKLAASNELDFTDEQKAVAKKIKETLHTYKNITHIYSTDETNPIMNVEYAKDLNTVINNMQAQIINNASEEVNG